MPTTPDFVYLMCTVKGDSFLDTVRLFFAAFTHAGMPAVERWSIPSECARKAGTVDSALDAIAAAGSGKHSPIDGVFEMAGDVLAGIYYRRQDQADLYGLRMSKAIGKARHGEMLDFIADAVEVCRYLLQHGYVEEAALFRDGGGLSSIPDVPLVHTSSHVAVVTEQQVREAYDDSEVFWKTGWDSNETYGKQRLLIRGLDIFAGPDYLTRILPQQWALARAAKPGLTEYYAPQVEPEEREVYRSGSATVDIVGHLAGENLIEFSCALEPGQHINGWEIFDIQDLLESGALPDGRQVDVVRVVFLECATARQEKRPLLDIGARVYCYDDAGELIELSD